MIFIFQTFLTYVALTLIIQTKSLYLITLMFHLLAIPKHILHHEEIIFYLIYLVKLFNDKIESLKLLILIWIGNRGKLYS